MSAVGATPRACPQQSPPEQCLGMSARVQHRGPAGLSLPQLQGTESTLHLTTYGCGASSELCQAPQGLEELTTHKAPHFVAHEAEYLFELSDQACGRGAAGPGLLADHFASADGCAAGGGVAAAGGQACRRGAAGPGPLAGPLSSAVGCTVDACVTAARDQACHRGARFAAAGDQACRRGAAGPGPLADHLASADGCTVGSGAAAASGQACGRGAAGLGSLAGLLACADGCTVGDCVAAAK